MSARPVFDRFYTPPLPPVSRAVFSLWTRTPMFRLEHGPLLVHTLAVCLAKQHFAEVDFVTDAQGAHLAQTLGWEFSSIWNGFEGLDLRGYEHIWALGKLVTLSGQERPCIHVDGDVLLFKPLPEHLLRARLVAQSPDLQTHYTGADMDRGFALCGLPRGHTAYNAGLLGGSAPALSRAFAWAGLELARAFHCSDLNGTTTSMLIEQYQLGVFAHRSGVPVTPLLPLSPKRAEITEAGYAHLAGANKRNPFYLARVEARLARDFPAAHARFIEGWTRLMQGDQCGSSDPATPTSSCPSTSTP